MTTPRTLSVTSLFLIGLFFVSFSSNSVHAQTISGMPERVVECVTLDSNLRYGQSDEGLSQRVSMLQQFLSQKGLLSSNAIGSHHFGPLTLKAVRAYQASVTLPSTGLVGPLTRASIHTETCGSPAPVSIAPVLYSLSATTTIIGATTSITGFGFTASNTIFMDGLVAAREVPISSTVAVSCTTDPSCHGGIRQTISFTMPESLTSNCYGKMMCPLFLREVTPGTYAMTVGNENGLSKPISLTIATSTSVTR